jgi:hypothetical protein
VLVVAERELPFQGDHMKRPRSTIAATIAASIIPPVLFRVFRFPRGGSFRLSFRIALFLFQCPALRNGESTL